MAAQYEISASIKAAKVGREVDVLTDGVVT